MNKQELVFGNKGPCSKCSKPGKVDYDPYEAEIKERDVLVLLCEKCWHEIWIKAREWIVE